MFSKYKPITSSGLQFLVPVSNKQLSAYLPLSLLTSINSFA